MKYFATLDWRTFTRHSREGGNPALSKIGATRHTLPMKTPTVYIMASARNGTLYIGVTSDLIKRVHQHRTEAIDGFSKQYRCKMLVWYEQQETMDAAITREKQLKKWNRQWKLRLIEETNPDWLDLWDDITA